MPRKKKEDEVLAEATTPENIGDNAAISTGDLVEPEAKKTKAVSVAAVNIEVPLASVEPKKKRSTRIGVVTSDKMTKTVVVRVDRLIKHPRYRKYVRRKKQFMAHDELGSSTGDKVMIVETRPLSARKRWRVVEIIQKAEK
jgi:small subunit ribosomal protein S17